MSYDLKHLRKVFSNRHEQFCAQFVLQLISL